MSAISRVALRARRQQILAELAAQRLRIDEVLTIDAAGRSSPIGEFPRSMIMKILLRRPALLLTGVGLVTKLIGARAIARFPNLYASVQLLRSLLASR